MSIFLSLSHLLLYTHLMHSSFTTTLSQPLSINQVRQVYLLLAVALLITVIGAGLGATIALPLVASGWVFLLFLTEIAILWTSRLWAKSTPLNYILFLVFPLISGLTVAPLLISIGLQYSNGVSIIMNAGIATTFLTFAAALFARSSASNLQESLGGILINSLLGLVFFALLQIFFPSLRGGVFESLLSGVGIVTFTIFLAVDIQRLLRQGFDSPFQLALSLYLDIFNLFLYVLRFMIALNGRRRWILEIIIWTIVNFFIILSRKYHVCTLIFWHYYSYL